MAKRPVFLADKSKVIDVQVDFDWFPGFAPSQKQKSIQSLHENFSEKCPDKKILEVSSKSELTLGVSLSAFNLSINHSNQIISFESFFQGSKVFEKGGPYTDIYFKTPREAKQDTRLKDSGEIIGFNYKGENWINEPKTFFYDWMYMSTVVKQEDLFNQLIQYDAFTDIEFNPKKSINCQAKAAALIVSLHKSGDLQKVLEKPENLLTYYPENKALHKTKIKEEDKSEQMKLF